MSLHPSHAAFRGRYVAGLASARFPRRLPCAAYDDAHRGCVRATPRRGHRGVQVQEGGRHKLNPNGRLVGRGPLVVIVAWLVGLVIGGAFGASTIALLGA